VVFENSQYSDAAGSKGAPVLDCGNSASREQSSLSIRRRSLYCEFQTTTDLIEVFVRKRVDEHVCKTTLKTIVAGADAESQGADWR